MDDSIIQLALRDVISTIQFNSGLDCPSFDNTMVPVCDIPCFDSKVWLVATTMLASKLEVKIPNEVNIFINVDSGEPHNFENICRQLNKIIELNNSSESAA